MDSHELFPRTPNAPIPQNARLWREGIVGLACIGIGILLTYTYIVFSARLQAKETPRPTEKPAAFEVRGAPSPDYALKTQATYAGWNREPPPPKPEKAKAEEAPLPPIPKADPIPPTRMPAQAQMFPSFAVPVQTQAVTPVVPVAKTDPLPGPAPVLTPAQTQMTPEGRLVDHRQPPPQPKPKKKPWLFAQADVSEPPYTASGKPQKKGAQPGQDRPERERQGREPGKDDKEPAPRREDRERVPEEERDDGTSQGTLIQPAKWEEPLDRTKVIYRSQLIHGTLQRAFTSDNPGDIAVLVSQHVRSSFGDGHILVPQFSEVVVSQEGAPKYGQKGLDVRVVQAKFPSGRLWGFIGVGANQQGQTGFPGKVDNHLLETVAGAGISAMLSVFARAPFGSPGQDQFQPNLAQEFGRDVAGNINQTGQRVVQRELNRPPTIYGKMGDEVTIQIRENVSFYELPRLVR